MFEAAYIRLFHNGELQKRVVESHQKMTKCNLCARNCGVNRLENPKHAFCRTGENAIVYSAGPHYGEESPISGRWGSGTIFFSCCNLGCIFCQNWEISHQGQGRAMDSNKLADLMLSLQGAGCHNINLVTPSHVIPQILAALLIAAEQGLKLPLVYNTGGYDSLVGLNLMKDIIDIYMPDMKFADSLVARTYLGVNDYAEVNRAAVLEMHKQVGDLILNDGNLARRGLLIRHLVLPNRLAGTEQTLSFIANEISPNTYLNIMGQYRPCFRAKSFPELNRRPSLSELRQARNIAKGLKLNRYV